MNILNTKTKNAFRTVTVVATSVSLLAGCMSFNPRSLRNMEAALLESNPNLVIESSIRFGIGALTMDFVDFAFVHDRSIDLSKISRAEVGVYELGNKLAFNDFTMPEEITFDSSCPQRQVILRVREKNEHMQMIACIRNEKVTGVAMLVLEPDEIVVFNARGDFEALINSVVKASVRKREPDSEAQASVEVSRIPAA